MAYLTSEELFHLVINAEPPPGMATDFQELKHTGSFSEGAQRLIHKMQIDQDLLRLFTSEPSGILKRIAEFEMKAYEFFPLVFAAWMIQAGMSYRQNVTTQFAVIPTRDEAESRFHDQEIDMEGVRRDVIKQVMDRIDINQE